MKKALCIIISTALLAQGCAGRTDKVMPQASTLTRQEQKTAGRQPSGGEQTDQDKGERRENQESPKGQNEGQQKQEEQTDQDKGKPEDEQKPPEGQNEGQQDQKEQTDQNKGKPEDEQEPPKGQNEGQQDQKEQTDQNNEKPKDEQKPPEGQNEGQQDQKEQTDQNKGKPEDEQESPKGQNEGQQDQKEQTDQNNEKPEDEQKPPEGQKTLPPTPPPSTRPRKPTRTPILTTRPRTPKPIKSKTQMPTTSPESSIPPSPEPSITITPSPEPSITITPSPEPSITITPSPEPSITITPSPEPSITITSTPNPTITQTPNPSISASPSPSTSVTTSPKSSSERSKEEEKSGRKGGRVLKILLWIGIPAGLAGAIAKVVDKAADKGSAAAGKIRDTAKAIKDKTAEQLGKMFGALKNFLSGIKFSDDDRKDGFTAFAGVFGGGGGSIRQHHNLFERIMRIIRRLSPRQKRRNAILVQDRERLQVNINLATPIDVLDENTAYRIFNIYLGNKERLNVGGFVENIRGNVLQTTVENFAEFNLPDILYENGYREIGRAVRNFIVGLENHNHERIIGMLRTLIERGVVNIEFYPVEILPAPEDPLTGIALENLDYDTIYRIRTEDREVGIMGIRDLILNVIGIEYDPNEDFQANIDRNRDALLRYQFYPTEQIPANIDQINTLCAHRETHVRGNLLYWLKKGINPYKNDDFEM